MADKKGPTATANRLAMSRALGAAFLNHQVEQLEKSVSGNTAGNWRERERRYPSPQANQDNTRAKRIPSGGNKAARKREGSEVDDSRRDDSRPEKDADIVVVDASVLVHGLGQVKKWCKEGRQEVIIVPLEALNTLDLLKKGTNALAQRARAASRILEAQVGTNPRIRVQRDDAFVLWDDIPFREPQTIHSTSIPEWVRRTICCARWEVEHASAEELDKTPKVVLAVLSGSLDSQDATAATPISASPVPLPAPQVNKHEPRSSGTLVGRWAAKAGLDILEVSPSPAFAPGAGPAKDAHPPTGRRSAEQGRRSPEEDRGSKRGQAVGAGGRGRRNSQGGRGGAPPGGGLVERPPAVMAMMEMVAQPSRVVRVLARGEKLDP